MSSKAIYVGVSQPFRDASNPEPIRRSEAIRECLNNVRECVGEKTPFNARLDISPTAMATGGYGQEAIFAFDPSQRNEAGHTVSVYARHAEEIEDGIWGTEEGRALNQERIHRTIARHEAAVQAIHANGHRPLSPRAIPIPDPTATPIPDPSAIPIPNSSRPPVPSTSKSNPSATSFTNYSRS
jgi:hypothetical protein